jgi:hypothetical protein
VKSNELRLGFYVKTWVLGPLVGLGSFACDASMSDDSCGSQVAGVVKVASWWGNQTESAEAQALAGLEDDFRHCNHDARAEVDPYPDKATLMQRLDALLIESSQTELNALPDVIQLNAGDTALKYASCAEQAGGILAPLGEFLFGPHDWDSAEVARVPTQTRLGNDLAAGAVWREPVDPSPSARPSPESWSYADKANWVLPYISCGSSGSDYRVVPIAIHHVNRLYYNVDRVRQLLLANLRPRVDLTSQGGTPQGTSLIAQPDDTKSIETQLKDLSLTEWLDLLKAEMEGVLSVGQHKTLVALPSDPGSGWALNLLAAENVKIAINLEAGRQPTSNDGVASGVMEVMDVIREASQLATVVEPWSVQRAMVAIASGEAAFTVMGDWSLPDVGEGVGMIPFPGTKDALVYTIDGFVAVRKPQPNGSTMTPQSKAWLRTINDENVAARFAGTKGAVSVKDWLSTTVKTCADDAFKNATQPRDCWVVPAMSMRGQSCEAANALQAWVQYPTDENRRNAELELATCGANTIIDGGRGD